MPFLRPSLDVVFKLLFADEANRDLLIALLEAVLRPKQPITRVEVANPEVERTTPSERGLTLDLVVEHTDGSRTDVEMQADNRGATAERALYHWARLYSNRIVRGDDFHQLRPCRVVFFLDFGLFGRLHSTFGVRDVREGHPLSKHLRIDIVEVGRADEAGPPEERALRAWASFIAAKSAEDLRRITMAHPDIEKASEALEKLSQDPEAHRLARRRRDDLWWQEYERTLALRRGFEEGREQGLEKGLERGLEKGREEGLRAAIVSLCEVLAIPLDEARTGYLEAAGSDELEHLRAHLVQQRGWPEPPSSD